ncbi:hypothetical protein ACGRPS_00140 [Vibrio furnissii]|uniref:hypothetical protein n=1 Tax=Vibrio furnissii TaxID=29494 RepID=UPI00374856C9
MSVEVRTNKHIRATWDRFNGSGQMSTVTLDEVRCFAKKRGLTVESVEEIEFGWNPRIKGVFIKTDAGSALYLICSSQTGHSIKRHFVVQS